jgi:hypothetical protein
VRSLAPATVSVALAVISAVWAWKTFDFWETIPMVPLVSAAGLFAAVAVYGRARRLVAALLTGVIVTLSVFLVVAFITLSRWEG